MVRAREIAAKLTLNKAIEGERGLDRQGLSLPSGDRSRRFGKAPRILLSYFKGWSSSSSAGWQFPH